MVKLLLAQCGEVVNMDHVIRMYVEEGKNGSVIAAGLSYGTALLGKYASPEEAQKILLDCFTCDGERFVF